MQEFIRGVRILIVAVCLALFAVGILWNLCYSALPEPDTDQTAAGDIEAVAQAENWEQQYTAEQMERPVEITKTESSILDRMNALPTECCVMEQQLQREVEEAGKLGRFSVLAPKGR